MMFFCGSHTAGKTSILKSLQEYGIIDYLGAEIGKELFYARSLNPAKQDDNFEFEVTQLELKRDALIMKNKYKMPAVESWHIGNLAYALERNPRSVERLIQLINTSPWLHNAYGIWLRVSKENIFKRTKTFSMERQWAAEFYALIDSKIESCFDMLGLTNYCIVDANQDLDKVIKDVHNIIQSKLKGNLCQYI